MAIDLKGRTALVTGAGRGIGRAVAIQLARAGASVMLNDLDRDVVFETGMLIDKDGGAAKAMPGDITAAEFPDKLVAATLKGFGSIDILVNNAGYTWDNVIQKTTDEQFQAMLDIHVVAPFRVLRAASTYIREAAKKEIAEGRRIMRKVVNITSIVGVSRCTIPGSATSSRASGTCISPSAASASSPIVTITRGWTIAISSSTRETHAQSASELSGTGHLAQSVP